MRHGQEWRGDDWGLKPYPLLRALYAGFRGRSSTVWLGPPGCAQDKFFGDQG